MRVVRRRYVEGVLEKYEFYIYHINTVSEVIGKIFPMLTNVYSEFTIARFQYIRVHHFKYNFLHKTILLYGKNKFNSF